MKLLSTRSLYGLLGLSVAILLTVFALAYQNIDAMIRHTRALDHTNRVLYQTEAVFSLLKDAETGQRGFLLTRDGSFLRPYQRAYDSVFYQLHSLRVLIGHDDPVQLGAVNRLDTLTHRRMRSLAENMRYQYQVRVSSDSLIGKLRHDAVTMNQARALVDTIRRRELHQLATGEVKRSQLWRLTPRYLVVVFTVAMLFFTAAFIAVIREVRRRRRYELELEGTVAELQRSNRELETFAYVASHDLQEPLRKLRTFSDRLGSRYTSALDDDGQFLVRRIEDSAARMQELIDALLTFSRLIGPETKENFAEVSLDSVLDTALDEYADTVAERGVVVERRQPLPVVRGSRVQLEQLFTNLLSNSLKFSRPDVTPHITIAVASEKGQYIRGAKRGDLDATFHKIAFADNGIGFDENFKEKIFVLFQRLHDRTAYEGSGIGLALCRKIVELHDGYIDVSSEPGQGSTFLIYLPVNLQPK